MDGWAIHQGDSLEILPTLPAGSVHCCVTSPPYFRLRSYLKKDDPAKALEIGSERTPAEYVAKIVAVCREARRVLHDSGTLWLNVADSYAQSGMGGNPEESPFRKQASNVGSLIAGRSPPPGLKAKDLCLIPERLLLALQADGWTVRSKVRWFKVSPMPESVRDRPTSAVEEIFMLSKGERYFYDQEAEREKGSGQIQGGQRHKYVECGNEGWNRTKMGLTDLVGREWTSRNLWNWWEVEEEGSGSWFLSNEPLKEAHYAAFPTELARRCISLGTPSYGVCPACLSPYRRVTERSQRKRKRPNEYVKRDGAEGTGNSCGNTVAGVSVQTLGWEATCRCDAGPVIPATVLDPFSGAGTTGLVARRLGRSYVGVELSAEYVELSRRRIINDAPLTNRPAEVRVEAGPSLFDSLP